MTFNQTLLAAYVGAIRHRPNSLAYTSEVIEKNSWEDGEYKVHKEVTIYRFDNGVIIRRTCEQDDVPHESGCAERWTSYKVVSNGDCKEPINPQRKIFENNCREMFWVKFHTTQS